jgi:inorganic phosphate transporter, PiT family
MDWLSILLIALTFFAVMLVSGNNLSACVGPAVGSRIISKRFGMLLGASGFSIGLLIQGTTMTHTVNQLMPMATSQLRAEALLVAIIIFVIADLVRVSMSLSMSLVGLFAGFSLANGSMTNGVYLAKVVGMWVAAPLIAIVVAFYLIRIINRKLPKNFWRRLQTYKILLIVFAFSTSYVLGTNTIGLIVATGGFDLAAVAVSIVAIFIGTFYLSAGEIRRVSQEFFLMRYPNATAALATSTILVEAATLFNIPLSNTQALSSAVFGTGISYKSKFLSVKPFLITVVSWVVAPILSFAIGFIIASV